MKYILGSTFLFVITANVLLAQTEPKVLGDLSKPNVVVPFGDFPSSVIIPDSLNPKIADNRLWNMPVYNPTKVDAKMLFWWPEQNYYYGMPNLLKDDDEAANLLRKDGPKIRKRTGKD